MVVFFLFVFIKNLTNLSRPSSNFSCSRNPLFILPNLLARILLYLVLPIKERTTQTVDPLNLGIMVFILTCSTEIILRTRLNNVHRIIHTLKNHFSGAKEWISEQLNTCLELKPSLNMEFICKPQDIYNQGAQEVFSPLWTERSWPPWSADVERDCLENRSWGQPVLLSKGFNNILQRWGLSASFSPCTIHWNYCLQWTIDIWEWVVWEWPAFESFVH